MSGFRLVSTEIGDLARDIAQAADAGETIARGVQEKYGRLVVSEARRLAPVRTGALRRSIMFADANESGRAGLTGIAIVADTEPETGRSYAGYVEFGTSRMAPRPFLRPALQKYAAEYRRELVDAAASVITKKGARAAIRGKSLYRGEGSLNVSSAVERS